MGLRVRFIFAIDVLTVDDREGWAIERPELAGSVLLLVRCIFSAGFDKSPLALRLGM